MDNWPGYYLDIVYPIPIGKLYDLNIITALTWFCSRNNRHKNHEKGKIKYSMLTSERISYYKIICWRNFASLNVSSVFLFHRGTISWGCYRDITSPMCSMQIICIRCGGPSSERRRILPYFLAVFLHSTYLYTSGGKKWDTLHLRRPPVGNIIYICRRIGKYYVTHTSGCIY